MNFPNIFQNTYYYKTFLSSCFCIYLHYLVFQAITSVTSVGRNVLKKYKMIQNLENELTIVSLREVVHSFVFIRASNILTSFNALIFFVNLSLKVSYSCSYSFSCSNKLQFVYLTITSHLACWKSRKFPISERKKRNFKEFP